MAHVMADIPQKALIEHDGKVLIVFDAVKKVWELPGGRINIGEELDMAAALQREIREELGVAITVGELFDAFIFIGSVPHCVVTYRCRLVGGPDSITIDGVEVGAAKWISAIEDIADLEMQEGYKRLLARYFSS